MAATAIAVAGGRSYAARLGLVDSPDDRKKHVGDVPLVGGIAIFVGICVLLLLTGQFAEHLPFLTAALLIVATGVWDDVRGVSPYVRLAVQAGAIGLIAVWGGSVISDLGAILPNGDDLTLGVFAVPFTIVAGVGLINAFNMTDGLDGLCGTLALAALVGVVAMAGSVGNHPVEVRFLLILSGAIVGFLLFNFPFPCESSTMTYSTENPRR